MADELHHIRPPEDFEEMVETFSDVFETHINPWSAAVTFGRRPTKPDEKTYYTLRMRMPLQQAKALAVLLLRGIRSYEEQTGADISLPQDVLDGLGIAPEDWRRFTAA